jgi:hypothetical protein
MIWAWPRGPPPLSPDAPAGQLLTYSAAVADEVPHDVPDEEPPEEKCPANQDVNWVQPIRGCS